MSVSLGRIDSLSVATLLISMDGGNADDCWEQSWPPSLAVGRIGSLPIYDTPAIPGSRKGIDEGTIFCGGIHLTTFDQVAQYIT